MSNSIRAPRRRPRIDSINFGSLRWILEREVALRVLYPHAIGQRHEPRVRRELADARTDHLMLRTRLRLNWDRNRRWYSC